jgi:hypothetical protein
MASQQLQSRIKELEEQVDQLKSQLQLRELQNVKKREKIANMSAEVVDSNPYRYLTMIIQSHTFLLSIAA